MQKAIVPAISVLLAACGDGPDWNVAGVAATGAPMAEATITLKCNGGAMPTTTSARESPEVPACPT